MNLNRRHKLTKEETERVKKITNSGRLYYDYDPLIESARNFAYETCRRYNRHEACIDELRSLFEKLGKNPSIADGFITEFGFNLSIGDDFDAGCGLKIIDCNEVRSETMSPSETTSESTRATMPKIPSCVAITGAASFRSESEMTL